MSRESRFVMTRWINFNFVTKLNYLIKNVLYNILYRIKLNVVFSFLLFCETALNVL